MCIHVRENEAKKKKLINQIRDVRKKDPSCVKGINPHQKAILSSHSGLIIVSQSRAHISGVVSQVQFNPLCGPPQHSQHGGCSPGPRRITSVSIKTDQYRVTRSRGRGKYPTKSFDTRTTLRQRRLQPLYCQAIALFFQHRGACGATTHHTFRHGSCFNRTLLFLSASLWYL